MGAGALDAREEVQVGESRGGALGGHLRVIFSLPQAPVGVPWNDEFDLKFLNYAPVTVAVVIIAVGLWWLISARHSFEGPMRQIKTDDTGRVMADEPAPG